MRRSLSSTIILLSIAVLLTTLLILAGCKQGTQTGPSSTQSIPNTNVIKSDIAEFIGNEACKDCHASEFKQHLGSHHALSLHDMSIALTPQIVPPVGRVPGTDIELKKDQKSYLLTIAGQPGDSIPLRLAFGSGNSGVTYASLMENGDLLEMRKSYFPAKSRWYLTPGHENRPASDLGIMYTPKQASQCILCHAVTHSASSVVPEKRFLGVGCESCHGPAGTHVAAMKAGNSLELHIEKLTTAKSAVIIKSCSGCHRSQEMVDRQSAQVGMTNRFQAYGLQQSRCYKESGEALSCVTCHNPHSDTQKDPKTYEAACLKCHSQAAPRPPIMGEENSTHHPPPPTNPCPVNPKTKCVSCHMPSRAVFKTADLPLQMADHFIRINPEKR